MTERTLTPEQIEQIRQHGLAAADTLPLLCELALDGLRFRVWCEGASDTVSDVGISRLAKLLANCLKPQQYRAAIDQFIVERVKR